MESPRKFNDCYFYYYSTCTKGDNCVFRHEPSALGCETMCTAWQQGKCLDKRCKLRHMELRKNRKQIPCYWENQPGGCRKKHCPFMHKNPDARTDGIAPSQPAPPQPACSVGVGVVTCGEPVSVGVAGGVAGVPGVAGVTAADGNVGVPAPAPMLWQHQQQRQVVLDSAILGVLPSAELVPHPRRPHEAYPLPVDPLVVNFEEESDNESAPSSTPTKRASPGDGSGATVCRARSSRSRSRSPRQELALLERIQAEAAALYGYTAPVTSLPAPRVYDRLSLDDLAGKKPPTHTERRKSLDFKILSLEEIRARKKVDAIVPPTPITLNLSRKRKLSTRETVTSAGNKIIKVVRSNSVVYKKVEPETPALVEAKRQRQTSESSESRKRTLSEASSCDIYDLHEDELLDDCQEFKRIKVAERTFKPRLIRNRPAVVANDSANDAPTDAADKKDDDSDTEVQIVSVNIVETNVELSDSEIIDVDSARIAEPVEVVDSSDDDDVTLTNVPDVVASCRKKSDAPEKDLLKDIDSILNGDDSNIEEL